MFPASTCGKKASCCARLKRCTSSTNTMVRNPCARARSARVITSLISLMPLITAEKGTNSDLVFRAMIRASVVFPQPGGPHSSREPKSSRSICVRSGFPGPSRSSCPMNSSSVRGRMRSARGLPARGSSSASMVRKSPKSQIPSARRASTPRFALIFFGPLASRAAAPLHTTRWMRPLRHSAIPPPRSWVWPSSRRRHV